MSNGNNPNDPPQEAMKKLRIVMTAEGYGVSEKEWNVPEILLRPYAIAYDAAISAVGLEISKSIYEEVLGGDPDSVEAAVAGPMISAVEALRSTKK